uniref:Macro domain-containing protein n=1 Tax=Xiphophorus couchianus TaxID=32473 RepID=A0A3B5LBS4_9TELE
MVEVEYQIIFLEEEEFVTELSCLFLFTERLLQLDREERRKEYRKGFTQLDDIPTWREENRSRTKEDDEKELTAGGGLGDKVSLYKGDITVLEVDAIVNAGRIDGCIHKSAGCCLYDECHSLNGCETGKAKITCGYDLPARYVIHTVGPVARGHVGDKEIKDLTSCYKNSLDLVKEYDLRTVAFPCISTGIYGYPNEPAADIALGTVKKWIEENSDKITRVIFCVFLETDFTIYKKKMAIIFQGMVVYFPRTAFCVVFSAGVLEHFQNISSSSLPGEDSGVDPASALMPHTEA